MPSIQAPSLASKGSEFYLQKSKTHLRLVSQNSHLPAIDCQSLEHLGARKRKKIENHRLVVINTHACFNLARPSKKLVKVAIDVKALAKTLKLSQTDALNLLQSPNLFSKLHLIGFVKSIMDTWKPLVETHKDIPKCISLSDYVSGVEKALLIAISQELITSEEDILDAFSSKPCKVWLTFRQSDLSFQIGPVIGKTFHAVKN